MRINAPHMKTESLPSSISASALWMRLLSPPVLCLVLLCVMLCWHIWLRDVQALFLPWVMFRSGGLGCSCCAGVKPLPSPCCAATAWRKEVGQIRRWCCEHEACLSPPAVSASPPAFLTRYLKTELSTASEALTEP